MDAIESNIHQVLVKLLDGTHRFLNFDGPSPSVSAVKRRIETLTSIPSDLQLLVLDNSRILRDQQILQFAQPHESPPPPFLETLARDSSIQLNPNQGANRLGKFPVIVHLLLRLKGGKGGFGSLLRGAATKAGQKKTNNFDACRDMNGRRLRHVNAEKKLEEWRAEAEERKLEKMAEEYIKKKGKEMAKKGKSNGGDSADKYVAKYREDSAKCMEEIERSVRESIQGLGSSKRKNLAEGSESASKRLKIRWGKRKTGDSDSEDLDSEGSDKEGEEENEKSVVIDNGSNSDSSKESETSPGSITDKKLVAESDDQGSSEGGSEDVDNVAEEPLKSDKSTNSCSEDENGQSKDNQPLCHGSHSSKVDEMDGQQPGISAGEETAHSAKVENSISEPVHKEPISMSSDHQISEKPLNIDEYHSAAELEVFGMERLKSELQSWGLKCGGTLQERAARLFLLKTTPLEMLPKKLFAKK